MKNPDPLNRRHKGQFDSASPACLRYLLLKTPEFLTHGFRGWERIRALDFNPQGAYAPFRVARAPLADLRTYFSSIRTYFPVFDPPSPSLEVKISILRSRARSTPEFFAYPLFLFSSKPTGVMPSDFNAQGFSVTGSRLEIGTDDEGVELTEWSSVANQVKLEEIETLRVICSPRDEQAQWCRELLALAPRFQRLRWFHLLPKTSNNPENYPLTPTDLAPFLAAVPTLEMIDLEYALWQGAALPRLDHLREFSWIAPLPTGTALQKVVTALGPSVKTLALDFGMALNGADPQWTKAHWLEVLTKNKVRPHRLHLTGIHCGDRWLEALFRSGLLQEVRHLDLSSNQFSGAEVALLQKHATKLPQLEKLVITADEIDGQEEDIDPQVYENLKAALGPGRVKLESEGDWSPFDPSRRVVRANKGNVARDAAPRATPSSSAPALTPAAAADPAARPSTEATVSPGTRRFTSTEGGANKFWAVSVNGADLTVHFGRIGTQGQRQTKTFPTPEAAQAEQSKLIREKTKKGYVEA